MGTDLCRYTSGLVKEKAGPLTSTIECNTLHLVTEGYNGYSNYSIIYLT